MSSFSDLKRSSKSNFDKLKTALSNLNSNNKSNSDDDLYWKPNVDKAGNGYAVIRFLPAPVGEDIPYIQIFDHGFQGPGGWYIEKSLTTIGQKDPVGDLNHSLWNSGIESDKETARKQKRRLNYVSNIYVVKDPSNPENEGKVFLFKYGKKIFDKLNDLMNPQFEDEDPINPFDLWTGANFKLKIRNVEGYRNYDKSEFDAPAPLLEDDDELERIWNEEKSLQQFLDPKNFKTFDELKAKLDRVLGLTSSAPSNFQQKKVVDEDDNDEAPAQEIKSAKAPSIPSSSDDDDDFDYFKNLVEED